MKTRISLLLVIGTQLIIGQNLVVNPSFENYNSCPSMMSDSGNDQLTKATGWSCYFESADYFNTCATNGQVKIPSNQMGFQQAHSGNAYAGCVSYSKQGFYREILGQQLISPLVIGQKYHVSFYVNMGGKWFYTMGINKMGVRFTTSAYNYTLNPISISNFAHVKTMAIQKDTSNWKLISGSFIADSSYKYIALGNFFDDANTDTSSVGVNAPEYKAIEQAYYYVDDICVSLDSGYCSKWTSIDNYSISPYMKVKIYPNPSSSTTILEFDNDENEVLTLTIFNSLGQVIQNIEAIKSDKVEVENLPQGLHNFQIWSKTTLKAIGKILIE